MSKPIKLPNIKVSPVFKEFTEFIEKTRNAKRGDFPEIYTNTCIRCGDKFDTYHKNFKFCPACEEEYKAEQQAQREKGR